MNKLAKTAIICTVIFLVFSIASAVLFVMAAPEIPRYTEEINQWWEDFEEKFPGGSGWVYGDDGYVEFYWDGNRFEFRVDDREWPDEWEARSAPESPELPDPMPPVSSGD